MFNRKYKYYVVYEFLKEHKTGIGSTLHITSIKANTSESLNVMKSSIEKDCDFDNIVIINIIKLR